MPSSSLATAKLTRRSLLSSLALTPLLKAQARFQPTDALYLYTGNYIEIASECVNTLHRGAAILPGDRQRLVYWFGQMIGTARDCGMDAAVTQILSQPYPSNPPAQQLYQNIVQQCQANRMPTTATLSQVQTMLQQGSQHSANDILSRGYDDFYDSVAGLLLQGPPTGAGPSNRRPMFRLRPIDPQDPPSAPIPSGGGGGGGPAPTPKHVVHPKTGFNKSNFCIYSGLAVTYAGAVSATWTDGFVGALVVTTFPEVAVAMALTGLVVGPVLFFYCIGA